MIYGRSLDARFVYFSQKPDPATQHVVPYRLKGVIVYLTRSQKEEVDRVQDAVFVLIGLFALCFLIEDTRPINRNEKP